MNIDKKPRTDPIVAIIKSGMKPITPIPTKVPRKIKTESLGLGGKIFSKKVMIIAEISIQYQGNSDKY